jgi:outer membrane receptor protein involved in Fe transport
VQTPTVNLARIHVSGVDTQLDWRVELEAFGISQVPGSVTLNLNIAYLDKYEIASLPGTPLLDYSSTIGNDALGGLSHPEWKGIATLTYANDKLQVGARARYVGRMRNSQNINSTLRIAGVASMTYLDVFGRFQLTEDIALRAGVTNAGDRAPPVWTGFGATDRATYDVIGRSYYVGATAHF